MADTNVMTVMHTDEKNKKKRESIALRSNTGRDEVFMDRLGIIM